DGAGQRARKVTERRDGTRRKERLYVGGFEIYRQYDRDGDNIARERETLHVMDDKQRIALVETLTRERGQSLHAPEPVQRYQLANHLGSATLELDEAARLISYEEYAPYGETVYQAGHHPAEVRRKRYRYTGKERDDENGFTYHGARYYAPWLGRWTSPDPEIDKAPWLSSYDYAAMNPVRLIDRSGHQPDTPDLTPENAELYKQVEAWIGARKNYPTYEALEEHVEELKAAARELLYRTLSRPNLGPLGQVRAAEEYDAAVAKADYLLHGGPDLEARVEASDLPSGNRVGFRDTPYKDLLREQLAEEGARLPRAPTQGGGGGPEGGEPPSTSPPEGGGPPSALPEGGGFWGGLKRLLGFGGKALDIGGKGLAVVNVATASNEGEALWASVGLLGAFGAFTPGVNIVLAAIGGIGLGIAAGRAIYHWWKGPQATVPVIDIPLPPEQVGPVTHVAHDDPPPPPRHATDATVPHSLRMRTAPHSPRTRNAEPAQLHFSITKGYDPATGKSW
ncbi:MAG TPA: RHS repeat-associated core domain-containing protein, partial [Stellaceae bacterium]|nr:RHS repeat-associated core domain-containing protein [Stellaceae bacterium]